MTLTITLTISVYVKVGLFLGFVEVTVYELRKDFNVVLFGPKKYIPSPFPKVERFNDSTKVMSVLLSSVNCESKDGTVADETIQCWQKKENPVIMTELNVARIEAVGTLNDVDLNCILSEIDMKTASNINFDWKRCKVQSGEVFIGGKELNGVGVAKFSNLREGNITLPTNPSQDFLQTTVGSGCDSMWSLYGSSDLTIRARETESGCFIDAPGGLTDAVLTIDFGLDLESCGSGYKVEVNENVVEIGGRNSEIQPVVEFGRAFKDVVLIMSPCDDEVLIKKTSEDVSYIEIVG